MAQNQKYINRKSGEIISRFAAQKKKAAIAIGLIVIMAFMWIRVLSGKKPDSAKAASPGQTVNRNDSKSSGIDFIDLPNVKGRNDVLTRDFFEVNGLKDFIKDKRRQNLANLEVVGDVSNKNYEEVVRKIVEKLNLDAIASGDNPQAFINDKAFTVGDKLVVEDGLNKYECEVVEILQESVSIKYGKNQIKLKMPKLIEEKN